MYGIMRVGCNIMLLNSTRVILIVDKTNSLSSILSCTYMFVVFKLVTDADHLDLVLHYPLMIQLHHEIHFKNRETK